MISRSCRLFHSNIFNNLAQTKNFQALCQPFYPLIFFSLRPHSQKSSQMYPPASPFIALFFNHFHTYPFVFVKDKGVRKSPALLPATPHLRKNARKSLLGSFYKVLFLLTLQNCIFYNVRKPLALSGSTGHLRTFFNLSPVVFLRPKYLFNITLGLLGKSSQTCGALFAAAGARGYHLAIKGL